MKYKVGDRVRIKSLDWYEKNKDILCGDILCGEHYFVEGMKKFCSEIFEISDIVVDGYLMLEDIDDYMWTDEMIEGLVEEETKPKFKVGDKIISDVFTTKDDKGWKVIDVERTGYRLISVNNSDLICDMDFKNEHYYKLVEEEMKSEDELLDEYEELTDRAFKGGYEKCQSDILLNGYELPEGYIFKDQSGNEIHALKIVLEKANTLKKQSDNMETETHRGYYTTEEDNTNKSKKVAWFTFWDNDFADKVELDLSNRELIQEDGKWFVVKKKKEYPKTYEECYKIMGVKLSDCYIQGYKSPLLEDLQELLICRDAYWKLYGEEMGLDKPWEPDWSDCENIKYIIGGYGGEIDKGQNLNIHITFAFPTKEMRDTFYENFKEEIEICKELL